MSIVAEGLSATKHELSPGADLGPYRYDHGNETWLLVIAGRPTVRHADGEDELAPGDVVCFPVGPAGAHHVINRSEAPVRVLRLATQRMPSVVVFPESGTVEVVGDGLTTRLRPA